MKKWIVIILCVGLAISASAQKIVSGIVTDEDGLLLIGVNIVEKGTTNGVITNLDGAYVINIAEKATLQFSYIGYESQNKIVKPDIDSINVTMIEAGTLDEILVSATNISRNSRSITYANQTIGAQSLKGVSSSNHKRKNVPSVKNHSINSLKGNLAGVRVNHDSGNVGSSSRVVLRGIHSLSEDSQPLYIIDGVPINLDPALGNITHGQVDLPLDQLSIENEDIKAINVLKGSNASALYGSRAINGVVIITTKSGNIEFPSLPYDMEYELIEDYQIIEENDFTLVENDPLSTFSIDVDRASYSNMRSYVERGQLPPSDAIRLEEWINYFKYDYPQPTDEHPVNIITEIADCPWQSKHKMMMVALQGKEIEMNDLPPSNLVFLIDVSGSMSSADKLPLLKESFRFLVDQLREIDKVSIVVYAGSSGLVLSATPGDDKFTILKAIKNLESGGSTAGASGILRAYEEAEKHFIDGGNNRVILATDGDFNVGISNDAQLVRMIEKKRESGVFLSVLGFGYGNYKDHKMQELAQAGNGNHMYIDNIKEAYKVFSTEFSGTNFTIAKDVKLQIEFNPSIVSGYRLIGYVNRLLEDHDFTDDQKDAGEIGIGHTVTALYEIIPAGIQSNFLPDDIPLKYSNKNGVSSIDFGTEFATVKLRYKEPIANKSKEISQVISNEETIRRPNENLLWASSVASFAMYLGNSKYIEGDYNNLKTLIEKTESIYEILSFQDEYKREFISIMKEVLKIEEKLEAYKAN